MGWRVHVSALVYGSLGSVLPSNYKVLTEQLRLTKRNANQLNRRISVACVQASYKIWRLHSGELNSGDTSRHSRPTVTSTATSTSPGTRTSDPCARPVETPPSVSSTSRTSTSTRQPRRASTRWGPLRSQPLTTPVPPRRTSTRWGPRRGHVTSSAAPDTQSRSRQHPPTQHLTRTSHSSGQPRSRSTHPPRRSSRPPRQVHPQVRREVATATRN